MNIKAVKTLLHILKTDLHRGIVSAGFIIGVCATLAIYFFGSVGMMDNSTSAIMAFVNTYSYNNIIDLLFLSSTFAYSFSFSVEWQDGFFRHVVIRSNPSLYALSKCISTSISGGLSVALGTGIFMIYLCLFQPTVMPDVMTIDMEVIVFKDVLSANHPILYFFAYLYIIFLQAMFFGLLGLTVSGYFPNKYVAYASPFILGFAMNQVANTLHFPNWMDPTKLALVRIYNTSAGKLLLVETAAFFTLITICTALFVGTVKGMIANE